MQYITASSSITHQPTFQRKGFSEHLTALQQDTEVMAPNYKDYIDGGLLRRMSKILRMSIACAKDCLQQSGHQQPQAIVVGTGLGCMHETEKFLSNSLTLSGMLPPTSFIQSTHNTIAGQISLILGNHGYNMTHSQNSLSFEHALIDAQLLQSEGEGPVLVGGADEHIPFLDIVTQQLLPDNKWPVTSGASFFMLENTRKPQSVALLDVEVHYLADDQDACLRGFLGRNGIALQDLDLVIRARTGDVWDDLLPGKLFAANRILPYLACSGLYMAAAAFGFHYAVDKMLANGHIKHTLILNNLSSDRLGLIILKNCEA
ncbi:beta-ketoacyl synthase chain length factor [Dyadobacter tibetensis]|uniref:beta-ketoacyl synthase chain length factor n=1 Tax=Dyadobacter tibetensis TaxID=1211851 RepID=UPI00046ECE96|nr:beta-ketoacyl synthase chain length factor [Dyadobacter tibetensis]